MTDKFILISIIVPCRNEEKFIGKCLDSVIAQDYPKENLEVLVIDGMSDDKTREIVATYQKTPFIEIIDNPKKVTPAAMNLGIKAARGEMITIVNAHSVLDKDFLRYGVKYLRGMNGVDAVGGSLKTINDELGIVAQAIPLAVDSLFGTGGNRYRTKTKEGFVEDTLPYSLYKKEVFSKIGYIDEELLRDQDEEFNYRLIKSGGKIYFTPKIKSFLHIRPSVQKLWRQHFQYGYWKVKVYQKVGVGFVQKQIVPALFVASLAGTFILSFFGSRFPGFFWLSAGHTYRLIYYSRRLLPKKTVINISFFFLVFFLSSIPVTA